MIHAIRATNIETYPFTLTDPPVYEHAIAALRAILKRPSQTQEKHKHNKHVSFNPNVMYQENTQSQDEKTLNKMEEDSLSPTRKETNNIYTQDPMPPYTNRAPTSDLTPEHDLRHINTIPTENPSTEGATKQTNLIKANAQPEISEPIHISHTPLENTNATSEALSPCQTPPAKPDPHREQTLYNHTSPIDKKIFDEPAAFTIKHPTTSTKKDADNIPNIVNLPAYNTNVDLNDAQLPYLNALYGEQFTPQSRQISLLDTGASYSFMHHDIFNRLPLHQTFIHGYKPLRIRTGCNQLLPDIATIAYIPFSFKDTDDIIHTITALFLVVQVISHEVFIGNDIILRCEVFETIGKKYLVYNNPDTNLQHNIPLTWIKTTPHIKLLTTQTVEIPPHRSIKVFTRPSETPLQESMLITNDTENQNDEEYKPIHVTNMMTTPCPHEPIPIIVTNNSKNYMKIEKYEEIASLVDTKTKTHFTDIYNVQAEQYNDKKHDDDIININQTHPWQTEIPLPIKDYELGRTREEIDTLNYVEKKLQNDPAMNDTERAEALLTFQQTGKYQNSATSVINKNSKLSELKKDNKKRLTPEQCVDSLNLHHFDQPTQNKIRTMFMKYESVLAKSDFDIPRAKGILADPIIRQEYVNKCMLVKYKSINLNIRDEVQEILTNMCDAGVIEETDEPTPFLSNLLVTTKRNGKLRLLYDCRPSNMAIVNIPSTFTPKTDITYVLGNAEFVSSIDLSNSYFQIGIHPDKRSLFSFCDAHGKRYRYCVLAQGFHSSPFYLNTLLNKAMKGLEHNVIYYADDIFIYTNKGQTFDDHLNIIEEVLKRLKAFNLKVKCSKIEIHPPCINILGVTRDRNGKFRIPDDKACILANWPEPTTPDAIKSFICTANYFNEHIYNFWNIVLPLQEQSKEKTDKPTITLTKESKIAFEKLKMAATKHIAISAPNLDKEFYISSDSSGFASAALLYQIIDNVVHYLGAASRLYTRQEQKYSTIKLEIMALLYAFSKWDYILRYSRHTINALTDAKGILYIKNGKDTTNMLYKISQIISHYDMRVMHTSGNPTPKDSPHHNKTRSNWLPDIISRCVKPTKIQNHKPVSEKELDYLMELLVLKEGHTITPKQLQKYMREPGLPSPTRGPSTKRTSKVKVTSANIQPLSKPTKKKHPPQFVNKHKHYPNQIDDNENNLIDYTSTGRKQPPEDDHTITYNSNTPRHAPAIDLNQMKPIQIFPTEEEARHYTYYRYAEDDIPCHALNIIRLLLDYDYHKNQPETALPTEPEQPELSPQPTNEELQIIQEANTITTDEITERLIINSKLIQDGMIALSVLLDAQLTDPFITTVKTKDPLPNNYSIKNGYLLHKSNGQNKFVIPQTMLTVVQNSLHQQLWGRHQPADKMYHILTKHFYLPNLLPILKRTVAACLVCNSTKLKNIKRQNYGKKQLPLANREMWMADIGGGYEDGPSKYFIVFADALTLFSVAIPIPNKNTETLLKAFTDNIINIFGSPKYFYSDNEPAFDSNEFKDYCISENIQIMHSAPYASFSNGNCENQIKLTKDIVRAYTKQSGLSYRQVLPNITRTLNNRPLTSSNDITPAKLMFGSNLHPQLLTSSTDYDNPDEYLSHFTEYMEKITKLHKDRRIANAERQREYHNRSRMDITFTVGQLVYYQNFKIPETRGSLENKWHGPAEIITLHANNRTVTIKDYDQITRIVHTHHIKHYETDGNLTITPTRVDERATNMLQSHNKTLPTDAHHLPITRSATTNKQMEELQPIPDTPPETIELYDEPEEQQLPTHDELPDIIELHIDTDTTDDIPQTQPMFETPPNSTTLQQETEDMNITTNTEQIIETPLNNAEQHGDENLTSDTPTAQIFIDDHSPIPLPKYTDEPPHRHETLNYINDAPINDETPAIQPHIIRFTKTPPMQPTTNANTTRETSPDPHTQISHRTRSHRTENPDQ